MKEHEKLAVLGGFFALWGIGLMVVGMLIVDLVGRRLFMGMGILFEVLGLSIMLLYVFTNSGQGNSGK